MKTTTTTTIATTYSPLTSTMAADEESCTFYQSRDFIKDQTNAIELTNIEVGKFPMTTDSVYDCCDICISNMKHCSAFLYDDNIKTCKQFKLIVKNEGGLRQYITYADGSFVGAIISAVI
jgi:hypothetical protein